MISSNNWKWENVKSLRLKFKICFVKKKKRIYSLFFNQVNAFVSYFFRKRNSSFLKFGSKLDLIDSKSLISFKYFSKKKIRTQITTKFRLLSWFTHTFIVIFFLYNLTQEKKSMKIYLKLKTKVNKQRAQGVNKYEKNGSWIWYF